MWPCARVYTGCMLLIVSSINDIADMLAKHWLPDMHQTARLYYTRVVVGTIGLHKTPTPARKPTAGLLVACYEHMKYLI
jgi:hypothetical protein